MERPVSPGRIHDKLGPERAQDYHDHVLRRTNSEARARLARHNITPQTIAQSRAVQGTDDAGYDPGVALLGKLHSGQGGDDIIAKAQNTLATDPEAFERLPDEVKSFYTAYQKHYHGKLGHQANPSPDWERTRHRNALQAGYNAASGSHTGAAMAQPLKKMALTIDKVTNQIAQGDEIDLDAFEASMAEIEKAVPEAYRNTAMIGSAQSLGDMARTTAGLFPGVGGADEAGKVAHALAKKGAPLKIQRAAVGAMTLTSLASGPLSKIGNKALSKAIIKHVGKDIAKLTTRDKAFITEALIAEGIEVGANKAVKDWVNRVPGEIGKD